METSTAARGVSQSPRKDHSSRTTRTEVQQGRVLADGDFCSTPDEKFDSDNLQQQLYAVARQREDLQRLQIELHARIIARSGVMEMQKNYDDQFKEHAHAFAQLQEQLHQKEQVVHEMEKRIEEKDRELHVVKLDNEAARAKENLLREQNKELQTYRKERDNSEAERSQHLKQIHELQEHIQDREQQLLELQEQNRVAQDANMYKDEQLREAQAWVARVQERDVLQSTTNHNLQAELRERTEQYNQLWLACQRQFGEVERLHMHTVQQLQIELANARERTGDGVDKSQVSRTNSSDTSQFALNVNQLEVNVSVPSSGNSADLPEGSVENLSSHVLTGTSSTQPELAHGVAFASSQVTPLHPFIMYQQGAPNSSPALISQSHVGQYQSVPTVSALQHWQNQQALPEGSQLPTISPHPSSHNLAFEAPVNGQAVRAPCLDVHLRQGSESNDINPTSAVSGQVDKTYPVSPPSQKILQHISSQFHDALKLDALPRKSEVEESQGSMSVQACSPVDSTSMTTVLCANINETTATNGSSVAGEKNMLDNGNSSEAALLDVRSLLACIVRTIPPGSGGRIRISSTLPNRLGKMLAPLHWHDYKKKFGKVEDFVAGHPELFLVEGDYIQLREGAQDIIAATAAVAKVAAAAKTSFPYSSTLPSISVTPMAQSYRQLANGNTAENSDPPGMANLVSKGSSHGSFRANSIGRQQDRRAGVASKSRR